MLTIQHKNFNKDRKIFNANTKYFLLCIYERQFKSLKNERVKSPLAFMIIFFVYFAVQYIYLTRINILYQVNLLTS